MNALMNMADSFLLFNMVFAFNVLAFWLKHIFIYTMVAIINIVYGLYVAAAATLYSPNWVVGLMIAILGLFCLFRAALKLFERE